MKYQVKDYSHALASSLAATTSREGEKKVLGSFLKLMVRNGDVHHAKRVLERTELLLAKAGKGDWVVIESARPLGEKDRAKIKAGFASGVKIEERINPDVVAGVRITVNGERELDATLATRLHRLFQ